MATACTDKKCFKHGAVSIRGGSMSGTVVSVKAKHTAIIERPVTRFFSKYRRQAKERSRIAAHNPECIAAKVGEMVHIRETRKLSKTKAWTITDISGKEKL